MRGMNRPDPIVKKHGAELSVDLKETITYLWPYLWQFKGHVIWAVLALISAKVASLLMPWALKEIVDSVD